MLTMKNRPRTLQQRLNNLFLVWMLLLFASCQEPIRYHSYQPVSSTGWDREDTLSYLFLSPLPNGDYEMQIGMRHIESYPYRDIWLGLRTNWEGDSLYHTDTLHLYLADERGDWYGTGMGGVVQFAQKESVTWSLRDSISKPVIQIFHLMNDSVLKGISDVGIRLSVASRCIDAEEDE